jgi:hypothetical protein
MEDRAAYFARIISHLNYAGRMDQEDHGGSTSEGGTRGSAPHEPVNIASYPAEAMNEQLCFVEPPAASAAECVEAMRQIEQTERDRVLWLIGIRLDFWRGMARGGDEEEEQDAPVALDVLEDLEQVVRRGVHQ